MKPITNRQHEVMSEAAKLPPLTAAQTAAAKRNLLPHIALLQAGGKCHCLDCGASWNVGKVASSYNAADKTADRAVGNSTDSESIVCPHCYTQLEVERSRKRVFHFSDYFMVVTKRGEWQVLRMFYVAADMRKGKAATYWISEALQHWFDPDGHGEVIARTRYPFGWYLDRWNWASPMELRHHCAAHDIAPGYVYGRMSLTDRVKRNGFRGDFHGINPRLLFKAILSDNRMETLLKVGQYDLLRHLAKTGCYGIDRYWRAAKVAIHHRYTIKDADLWCDMVNTLSLLDKDITNPKFVCPANLQEAHDHWQRAREAYYAREREQRERQRQLDEEAAYLADRAKVAADEAHYLAEKSRFFDIAISGDGIIIKPLQSVAEFLAEARSMHHCVFSNRYFAKPQSLILHALVNGELAETLEINLETLQLVQSRGRYNQRSVHHDRIVALMQAHLGEVARRLTASPPPFGYHIAFYGVVLQFFR